MSFASVNPNQEYPRLSPAEGRVPTGEFINQNISAALEDLQFRGLWKTTQLAQAGLQSADEYNPILSPDEANQKWGIPDGGIGDGGVKFDKPITAEKAFLIHNFKLEERKRNERISKGTDTAGRAIVGFGAGMAAQALDPINVGTMFLFPGFGKERLASIALKSGETSARIAGAMSGVAAGMATTEPAAYFSKWAGEQNEYNINNSVVNFIAGTFLGTGITLGVGAIADGLAKSAKDFDKLPRVTQKKILAAALGKMTTGEKVDTNGTVVEGLNTDIRRKAEIANKKAELAVEDGAGVNIRPPTEEELLNLRLSEIAAKQTKATDPSQATRILWEDLTPAQRERVEEGTADFDILGWEKTSKPAPILNRQGEPVLDGNGVPMYSKAEQVLAFTRKDMENDPGDWKPTILSSGKAARERVISQPDIDAPGQVYSYGKTKFLVKSDQKNATITITDSHTTPISTQDPIKDAGADASFRSAKEEERLALLYRILRDLQGVEHIYLNGRELDQRGISFLMRNSSDANVEKSFATKEEIEDLEQPKNAIARLEKKTKAAKVERDNGLRVTRSEEGTGFTFDKPAEKAAGPKVVDELFPDTPETPKVPKSPEDLDTLVDEARARGASEEEILALLKENGASPNDILNKLADSFEDTEVTLNNELGYTSGRQIKDYTVEDLEGLGTDELLDVFGKSREEQKTIMQEYLVQRGYTVEEAADEIAKFSGEELPVMHNAFDVLTDCMLTNGES